MHRTAFVDDQLIARDFNTNDVVRKAGLHGRFLSPYVGRVLFANPAIGTVQVQWPWGAEQEFASELIRDVSEDFLPTSTDQSYSTWEGARNMGGKEVLKADQKFRKSLASRVALKYENEVTKPLWRAACEGFHCNMDEFALFTKMASVFGEEYGQDAVRLTVANLFGLANRIAIYWKDPKRRYKVTQQEKASGVINCPRCKGLLKPRVYRQGRRILLCKTCGFSIAPRDIIQLALGTNMDKNLIRIAIQISSIDPILAYELEQRLNSRTAGNPDFQKFDDHVEKIVSVLKSLKNELTMAVKDLDDAKEFAKFFSDIFSEEEELKKLLKSTNDLRKSASARTAGPVDWFKKLLNKPQSKSEESDSSSVPSSYNMDDSAIDEFVDGKREWNDSSHYIEQEFKENKEFFGGVKEVMDDMAAARKSPTKELANKLLKKIERLIGQGTSLLKGVRQHLLEPAGEVTMEGDDEKPSDEPKKSEPIDLEGTVNHYTEALKDAAGDEKKIVKLLKELFTTVGPLVEEDRVSFASKMLPVLLRTASTVPSTRRVLLPFIRRHARAALLQHYGFD